MFEVVDDGYEIVCDNCDDKTLIEGYSYLESKKIAEEDGFIIKGSKCFCCEDCYERYISMLKVIKM